jgi:anti-sigma regulatory factor (Ser/Thr protein kinase)
VSASYLFKTTARVPESRRLAKAVISVLDDLLSDPESLYELELALTEACFNVARHAYPNRSPGEIEVMLMVEEPQRMIRLEISDWGEGSLAMTGGGVPIETSESGRGLYIIWRIADKVESWSDKGKNTIGFSKRFREDQWRIWT